MFLVCPYEYLPQIRWWTCTPFLYDLCIVCELATAGDILLGNKNE